MEGVGATGPPKRLFCRCHNSVVIIIKLWLSLNYTINSTSFSYLLVKATNKRLSSK